MSSNGWREVKLGDEIELLYGKGLVKSKRNESGSIPVYGSNGPVGFHDEALINKPGIIIGRKGTVGSINYSAGPFYPIDTTYYLNPKNNDLKFMYYFLQTLGLSNMNTHSAVPGLNRDNVYSLIRELPEFDEQKAIAATLSCLDDKIELNNRINKTLEEIAQAIFKSWFVDFEPFQDGEFEDSELGRIPKGWRVADLDNIADYLNGLAMQKYRPESNEFLPVVKIKELNQGFTDENSDKASINIPKQYVIQDGDVIFSWSGTLMVKIWSGGIGGLNQHLFKVTSDKYDKWFYYLWTLKHLERFRAIAKDKATTMGHIKRSHLSESKVLIPKESDMNMMNSFMNPVFTQIVEGSVQSGNLKAIRDSLLPKLMSGEIRVPIEEVQ